ncbi:MAG: tRNA-splicing endonuclease [Promethearchaeota archaeon]|nr:MAG: tRNA-splicing endonuclease [Candidatus Lokiarchaeota archaeon]
MPDTEQESEITKEKIQIEGFIEKDKVVVEDEEGIDEFYEQSYIGNTEKKNGKTVLILEPIEVLLLHERKRILLWRNNDKNGELYNFEGLLSHFSRYDEYLWQKYVIFMDLRRRGYIVRSGFGGGIDFMVYKRGADFRKDASRYLIYPVFEGNPIELRDLDRNSRVALSSRKELIVATVDRLSRPIYYNVNKFEILSKDIEGESKKYGR